MKTINFQRRSIVVNGLVIASVCVVVIFFSKQLLPVKENFAIDLILDSIGVLFLLFGICLRASARGYKSKKLSEISSIVTDGPYKLTQNPMYLASFLIGLGVVIIILKWWMVFIYIGGYLLWYWPQIYNERKVLLRKYGQDYLNYSSQTPLFFPKLKTVIFFRSVEYLPLTKKWIKGESVITIVWILVILTAELYQNVVTGNITLAIVENLVLAGVTFSAILALRFTIKNSKFI